MRHFRWAIATVFPLLSIACSTEAPTLRVDIVTDLAPGQEFDLATLELDGLSAQTVSPNASDDWGSGVRIGTFVEVASGTYEGSVVLSQGGESVLSRALSIRVAEDTLATFVLDRRCVNVECPRDSDAANETACLRGECVDPSCDESPGGVLCVAAECDVDAPCSAGMFACLDTPCASGVCLSVDTCVASGQMCTASGCQSDAPAPTCSDSMQNGEETGVDCGGPCPACETGGACALPSCTCDGTGCFFPEDCTANRCVIDCGDAACTATCSAEECVIRAGEGSTVDCQSAGTCAIEIESSVLVGCNGEGTCEVTCTSAVCDGDISCPAGNGGCYADCTGSGCQFSTCSGSSGLRGCGPGRLSCNQACP